jgi:Apea-like HEPN
MEKARELTDAGFRNRALSNIGSLKGVNLTDKIVQRFNSLPPALKVHFKDAPLVIRKSVGVRNYFIHGSDPKINPGAVYEFLPFFTKLLEFVFVTSYLTDLGWSAERWIKKFSPSCLLKDLIESFEADVAKLRRELN